MSPIHATSTTFAEESLLDLEGFDVGPGSYLLVDGVSIDDRGLRLTTGSSVGWSFEVDVVEGDLIATFAPDEVGFLSAVQSFDEGAGVVTLGVLRSGRLEGSVSIDFETIDGTAFAGSDFSASSGTLEWSDGAGVMAVDPGR